MDNNQFLVHDDHNELLPSFELIINNPEEKRAEIKKAFNESYSLYEELFDLVDEEGHFMRADPLRHPLIFYLGHTAAFYINKFISQRIIKNSDRIDSDIESLVAIGVDEMSW
jgi:site-specific DNA-adenine methylase